MPVTNIRSSWSSGSLIFHKATAIAPSTTYNVFTLGTGAVKVGDTANDVDFQYYGTGSLSAIIDCGAATFTLVGIATTTDGAVTITNATASTSTTTGALKVTGGVGIAKGLFVGEVVSVGTVCQPDASDGATLGTASLMWSDLYLASGGVIYFNNTDVTLTHAANLLTLAGGALNMGSDGAGLDVKAFGGTASCSLLYDASEDQLVITQTNNATTGVERTLDVSQTHTGIGASAEALRATITTDTKGGTYMNALFGKIDFATTGLVTGLAGVICGELTMPGGTIAGGAGTYCVFEAEINCPTSYDSSVPIHVMRISAWGAQVAYFDDYGYLFEITGVTSGAAHFWYDAQKSAPAIEEFIRVKMPSGDRFLALYNANA